MGKAKVKPKPSKEKKKTNKLSRKMVVKGADRGKGKQKKWRSKKPEKLTEIDYTTKVAQKLNRSEKSSASLREKMMRRLNAARFRQLNEELDSSANEKPEVAFGSETENFKKYHEAYRERKEHWAVDPLDLIITWIKENFPPSSVIADFGCGDARLASSVPNTVNSFDLFALNERVTACDMSHCPLKDSTVDVAVFCLSLMGTNVGKYIVEANRVLKQRGILKIAEVASRFQETNPSVFIKKMKKFGFIPACVDKKDSDKQNSSQNSDIFYMFEFRKVKTVREFKGKPPVLKLNPSVYKKR